MPTQSVRGTQDIVYLIIDGNRAPPLELFFLHPVHVVQCRAGCWKAVLQANREAESQLSARTLQE